MRLKQTTTCKWCNSDKGYTLTQECHSCWEIRTRIEREPEITNRIIAASLVYERERNANNVANADLQIAELQAEITRLRAGGCARDQHTTQYCGEMGRLVERLTALAEEWRTDETWDKTMDETLRSCANRLLKAIDGGDANQVGLLDIADAVIAEREGVK